MTQNVEFCSLKTFHDHCKAFEIAVVCACCRVPAGTGKLQVADASITGERVNQIMHNLMGKG